MCRNHRPRGVGAWSSSSRSSPKNGRGGKRHRACRGDGNRSGAFVYLAAKYRSGGADALSTLGRPSNLSRLTEAPSAQPLADGIEAKQRRIAELERKIGQQLGTGFFSCSLAACQGTTPAERRGWRDGVYALIHAETPWQGDTEIERICWLAGVSRAGYYRHWQDRSHARRRRGCATRSSGCHFATFLRLPCGYRLTVQLKRLGWTVNHKRVARIRREDNCFACRSRRSARRRRTAGTAVRLPQPGPGSGADGGQPDLGLRYYLHRLSEAFVYLAVVLDGFSRRVIGWAWPIICVRNWRCRHWIWPWPA